MGLGLASLLDFREVVVLRLVEHQDGRLLGSLARRQQAAVDFHLTTDAERGRFAQAGNVERLPRRSVAQHPDGACPVACLGIVLLILPGAVLPRVQRDFHR